MATDDTSPKGRQEQLNAVANAKLDNLRLQIETPTGHRLMIEEEFLYDGVIAFCSCGWRGPSRLTRPELLSDFDDHLSSVRKSSG